MNVSEKQGMGMRKARETDSILSLMIIGERFASLTATELCNLCIALETMAKIIRISGHGYSDRVLCVWICLIC
jgi:hypothetical protein